MNFGLAEPKGSAFYFSFDRISLIKIKVGISMKLDNNNHSMFLLYYYLVLVVKYRRNVFNDDISVYAKDMFVRLSENYNITLAEWNHDVDHVHILFKAHQERLSTSENETLERDVLVKKFLLINYWRFSNRRSKEIY